MGNTAGSSGMPYMKIETLRKLIKKFTASPDLILQKLFPTSKAEGDTVEWETHQGSRGMAPFKAPGAITQKTAPLGKAEHEAKAAFWGEMMDFDEEFLNNINSSNQNSSKAKREKTKAVLARNIRGLASRCLRRKEWMLAQMIMEGKLDYVSKDGGLQLHLDYGIPDNMKVAMPAGALWTGNDQTERDILGNIQDGKQTISDCNGGVVNVAFCSLKTLGYLSKDEQIRDMLSKEKWGDGKLFKGPKHKILGVNKQVIEECLDIPKIVVYEEKYEVRAMALSNIEPSSTEIVVPNATEYREGTVAFFNMRTGKTAYTIITGILANESKLVIEPIGGTVTYPAQQTFVRELINFIPDGKFTMMATHIEGEPIAGYEECPYGLDQNYGLRLDMDRTFDPEAVTIRAQDKGLPVLFQNDAIYQMDID